MRQVPGGTSGLKSYFRSKNQKVSKKKACGIKTLFTVKTFLPVEFCPKLLNALVLSEIQHPVILLDGLSQNLITSLEKIIVLTCKSLF